MVQIRIARMSREVLTRVSYFQFTYLCFAGKVDSRVGIATGLLAMWVVVPSVLLFNRQVGFMLLASFDCWYIVFLMLSTGLIGAFLFIDPGAGVIWGLKWFYFMPLSSCFADASPARNLSSVRTHYGKSNEAFPFVSIEFEADPQSQSTISTRRLHSL